MIQIKSITIKLSVSLILTDESKFTLKKYDKKHGAKLDQEIVTQAFMTEDVKSGYKLRHEK